MRFGKWINSQTTKIKKKQPKKNAKIIIDKNESMKMESFL